MLALGIPHHKTQHRFAHALSASGQALMVCALLTTPAYAEVAKQDAAMQQVLKKAQGALRQLSEEKAKLEADNAALQKDKTALEGKAAQLEAQVKQLAPLVGELEKQKAATEAMKNAGTALEGQLSAEKTKEQQLREKTKEIVNRARQIQSDNLLLVEAVKEREQWISQCQEKNQGLGKVQADLIQHYGEKKNLWQQFVESEPLTGIGQVQVENTAQEYQYKLDDLKATPFQSQIQTSQGGATAAQQPAVPDDADETEEPPQQ